LAELLGSLDDVTEAVGEREGPAIEEVGVYVTPLMLAATWNTEPAPYS
jgi:hypothetical protein